MTPETAAPAPHARRWRGWLWLSLLANALLAWWLTGRLQVAWSAGYGALSVVLPAAPPLPLVLAVSQRAPKS